MKENTWFDEVLYKLEATGWDVYKQNMFVVCLSGRLGRKICDLWGENYDRLKEVYRERMSRYLDSYITITKDAYVQLLVDQEALSRLRDGGVDDWEWYDESLNVDGKPDMDTFEDEMISLPIWESTRMV